LGTALFVHRILPVEDEAATASIVGGPLAAEGHSRRATSGEDILTPVSRRVHAERIHKP
jgi:hypothetical protein